MFGNYSTFLLFHATRIDSLVRGDIWGSSLALMTIRVMSELFGVSPKVNIGLTPTSNTMHREERMDGNIQ